LVCDLESVMLSREKKKKGELVNRTNTAKAPLQRKKKREERTPDDPPGSGRSANKKKKRRGIM